MKPVEGLALGGRYHLVRRIAVGGMGEVWVAQDSSLGRDVAVKVLREEFAGNIDFLRRLRTEARNNARLSHPGIAQMYDYGEKDGSGYLVMELVLGEPMSDLLEREPVVPIPRLLPILSQAARGLHAAHSAGVVHRDVKPGNILLDRSGGVKLTDFGVSLAANQVPMTATGMVMGTAQYLSPEQAIGKPATPSSDVYALGIVAYESLAGKRPFTGPTPVDIAVAHVNQQVPPLPAGVDRELAGLVLSALAKDPAGRPPTAAAFAQTVESIGGRVLRAGRAGSPRATATVEQVAVAPRSYPPRRVVQSRTATDRTAERADAGPRSAGRHQHVADRRTAQQRPTSTAAARPRPVAAPAPVEAPPTPAPRPRPTTRAAVREARATTPSRPPAGPGREALHPQARAGAPWWRSWTWPAVALVALVVVILVAAILGHGGGSSSAGGMTGGTPGNGMIFWSATGPSAPDTPTKDKDA
jgi:serine/threonine-protein kinase